MHLTLYYLVLGMYPRMMVALDENLQPLKIDVWVGQALDSVAGAPKQITGFTNH